MKATTLSQLLPRWSKFVVTDLSGREPLGLARVAAIEAAFRLHGKMGGGSGASNLVQEKLEKLAERKKKLVSYREELLAKVSKNADAKVARAVIEDRALEFKKGWPKSSPATQKRLVRRLVEQLIYSHEGIRAFYVTTKDTAASLAAQKEKVAPESFSGATPNRIYSHSSSSRLPSRFFSSGGAPVLQVGGPDWGLRAPHLSPRLHCDQA